MSRKTKKQKRPSRKYTFPPEAQDSLSAVLHFALGHMDRLGSLAEQRRVYLAVESVISATASGEDA